MPALLFYSDNSCREKLPKMPLMNFTVSGVSYFLAISTASLMAAALGISGIYITSYIATRIMAEATRGMRENRQPLAYFSM